MRANHSISQAIQTSPPVVHDLLVDAARNAADHIAVDDGDGAWTYAQLHHRSAAVAAWLADQGVAPGDRVIALLPNGRPFAAVCFGTSMRGAVFVPLHPATGPRALRAVLHDARPTLLLASAADVDALRSAAAGIAPVHDVDTIPAPTAPTAPTPHPTPIEPAAPPAPFALIYTSGSTSSPKGVICPHPAVRFATDAISSQLDYGTDDIVLTALPMSFDYGLYQLLLCAQARCTLALAPAGDPLLAYRRLRRTGATVVPVVPSLARTLVALAARERPAASSVRMFTNTGDTLTPDLTHGLRREFPGAAVTLMFGITECKRVSIAGPDADRDDPSALGRPLPGTRIDILDAEGQPLPPGRTGQIVVSGPHLMAGYWGAPELSAAVFRPDGPTGARRLHTGDYGHLDEAGQLHFEGRRDSIFKRRGVRMSTAEIEAAALDITGVRAAVVLAPDDEHDLALCVDADLEPQEILRRLGEQLEAAKVPATCTLVGRIPLTDNGKPARRELAELVGAR